MKCVSSSPGSIACIAALYGSTQVVTGSHDGDITVWNCDSLEVQQTVKAHRGSVMSLQVSKDDSLIVSASNDKTLGLYQIHEGQRVVGFFEDAIQPHEIAVIAQLKGCEVHVQVL